MHINKTKVKKRLKSLDHAPGTPGDLYMINGTADVLGLVSPQRAKTWPSHSQQEQKCPQWYQRRWRNWAPIGMWPPFCSRLLYCAFQCALFGWGYFLLLCLVFAIPLGSFPTANTENVFANHNWSTGRFYKFTLAEWWDSQNWAEIICLSCLMY